MNTAPKAPLRAAPMFGLGSAARPRTWQVLCVAGLCGIAAKTVMSTSRYQRLIVSASTNVVNVSSGPVWSLVASGFVFPSWSNVAHLAGAIAATYVIETCPAGSSKQAAGVLAAGHIGVSWAMATVQKSLISKGWVNPASATTPDDVGSSYLSYAAATAALGVSVRRLEVGRIGQIAAMSTVIGPLLASWSRKPNHTNAGHLAAAVAGGLAVLIAG